eukprot:1216707-Rhodomonas_salina.1
MPNWPPVRVMVAPVEGMLAIANIGSTVDSSSYDKASEPLPTCTPIVTPTLKLLPVPMAIWHATSVSDPHT